MRKDRYVFQFSIVTIIGVYICLIYVSSSYPVLHERDSLHRHRPGHDHTDRTLAYIFFSKLRETMYNVVPSDVCFIFLYFNTGTTLNIIYA